MTETVSDGELARAIATKTDDAQRAEAELCRRFAPRIRLYGLRHLRSEDRAQDLVQAVLVATLTAIRKNRVEDLERIDRYMLGTCRLTAQRIREVEKRLVPVEDEELDVQSFVPSFELLDTGALVHCLSKLEPRARMVVYFTFNEERTPQEIAKELETTLGNIRVLRHRAIASLRTCMEGGR